MVIFLIIQVVILITCFMFYKNLNRKKSNTDEEINSSQPIWETLGLTKEEYNEKKQYLYCDFNVQTIYKPEIDNIDTSEEVSVSEDYDYKQPNSEIPLTEEEKDLKTLLGIENDNEFRDAQFDINKEAEEIINSEPIDNNQNNVNMNVQTDDYEISGLEPPNENDNEFSEVINTVHNSEAPLSYFDEPEQSKKNIVTVAAVGESEGLFEELLGNVQEIVEQESVNVFSEETIPLPADKDIPLETENEEYKIQQVINLMNSETKKQEQINEINKQLSILSSSSGKDNMKEILYLLKKLYTLEGKEKELKELMQEYNDYFEESDIYLNKEDIILKGENSEEETLEIPDDLIWLATSTISKENQGEQYWVGKIIGDTQSYIHFKDSTSRSWVDVSNLEQGAELNKEDFYLILVERKENSLAAIKIQNLSNK